MLMATPASAIPIYNWNRISDVTGTCLRVTCFILSLYQLYVGLYDSCLPSDSTEISFFCVYYSLSFTILFGVVSALFCFFYPAIKRKFITKANSGLNPGKSISVGFGYFSLAIALTVSSMILGFYISSTEEHLMLIIHIGLSFSFMNLATCLEDDNGILETILSFGLGIIGFQYGRANGLKTLIERVVEMVVLSAIPASKHLVYPVRSYCKEWACKRDRSSIHRLPDQNGAFVRVVHILDVMTGSGRYTLHRVDPNLVDPLQQADAARRAHRAETIRISRLSVARARAIVPAATQVQPQVISEIPENRISS